MGEVGVHDDGERAGTEVEPMHVSCTVRQWCSLSIKSKRTLVLACLLEVGVAVISADSSSDIRYGPLHRSPQAAWRHPEFHPD
jgi:hypothetical protein